MSRNAESRRVTPQMVLVANDEQTVASVRGTLTDLARKKVGYWSHHDREDLVQDALEKALRKPRLPGEAPLKARALTAFRDELIDAQRRRSRSAKREQLREEIPDSRPEPERSAAFLELAAECAALKAQLGLELLEFAIMRADDLTYDEIAARDGWDQQRVDRNRVRLRRKQSLLTNSADDRHDQRKEAS